MPDETKASAVSQPQAPGEEQFPQINGRSGGTAITLLRTLVYVVQKLGLGGTISLILIFVFAVGGWFGGKALLASHIEFVNATAVKVSEAQVAIDKHGEHEDRQTVVLKELLATQKEILVTLKEIDRKTPQGPRS